MTTVNRSASVANYIANGFRGDTMREYPGVDGEASVEELSREIFDCLLATASGQPTKSEAQGFGDDEFVPWVPGAQM